MGGQYENEEIGINAGNWVDSAQDRDYWRALVNIEDMMNRLTLEGSMAWESTLINHK